MTFAQVGFVSVRASSIPRPLMNCPMQRSVALAKSNPPNNGSFANL